MQQGILLLDGWKSLKCYIQEVDNAPLCSYTLLYKDKNKIKIQN